MRRRNRRIGCMCGCSPAAGDVCRYTPKPVCACTRTAPTATGYITADVADHIARIRARGGAA